MNQEKNQVYIGTQSIDQLFPVHKNLHQNAEKHQAIILYAKFINTLVIM